MDGSKSLLRQVQRPRFFRSLRWLSLSLWLVDLVVADLEVVKPVAVDLVVGKLVAG